MPTSAITALATRDQLATRDPAPTYTPGNVPDMPTAMGVPDASTYTDQYAAPELNDSLTPLGTSGQGYINEVKDTALNPLASTQDQYDPTNAYQTALGARDATAIDAATDVGRYEVDYNKYLDPATATVSSQLDKLLSQDSSYISRARKEAEAKAASTGMLSSSMAAGAAEGAAIDRALPIAQADASTYAQFGLQGLTGAQTLAAQGQQGQITSALQSQAAAESAFNVELNAQLTSQLQLEDAEYNRLIEKERAGYALTAQEEAYKQNSAIELERATYDQILNKETAGYELTKQEAVFKQNAILNQQAATDAQNLATLEGQISQALEETHGVVNAEIQSMQDQAAMQRTVVAESSTTARVNAELSSLESRNNATIAANLRESAANNIADIESATLNGLANINMQPDDMLSSSAKRVASDALKEASLVSLDTVASVYGADLTHDNGDSGVGSTLDGEAQTMNSDLNDILANRGTGTTSETGGTLPNGSPNASGLSESDASAVYDKLIKILGSNTRTSEASATEAVNAMNSSGVNTNPRGLDYGFVFADNSMAQWNGSAWVGPYSYSNPHPKYTESGSSSGYDVYGNYYSHSCFTPSSCTTKADGSIVTVAEIKAGDKLLGANGVPNEVLGIEKVPVGDRKLWNLEGTTSYFTGEHPFLLSEGGWGSFDKAAMDYEIFNEVPVIVETMDGMRKVVGDYSSYDDNTITQISYGASGQDIEGNVAPLNAIVTKEKEEFVYTMFMSGDRTWNVEGLIISGLALSGDNPKLV